MSQSTINTKNTKKDEYVNFFKADPESISKVDKVSVIKKELRNKMKEKLKVTQETLNLENKIKALKIEESRAIKKIDHAKRNLSQFEIVRKNLLSTKIYIEEGKAKQEKGFELNKEKACQQRSKVQKVLKGWWDNRKEKKIAKRVELSKERRANVKCINNNKQEEEEKNKQICIRLKTSKINFVDRKQQIIKEKRTIIRKEIEARLKKEQEDEKDIKLKKQMLETTQNTIKENLKTIENSNIEECKRFSLLFTFFKI